MRISRFDLTPTPSNDDNDAHPSHPPGFLFNSHRSPSRSQVVKMGGVTVRDVDVSLLHSVPCSLRHLFLSWRRGRNGSLAMGRGGIYLIDGIWMLRKGHSWISSLSPVRAYGKSHQNLQIEDVEILTVQRYGRKSRSQHNAHRLHGKRDYERKFRWDHRCQSIQERAGNKDENM